MKFSIEVFHTLAKAQEIVCVNTRNDEDGWTYDVVRIANYSPDRAPYELDRCRVEVKDETGTVVGYL